MGILAKECKYADIIIHSSQIFQINQQEINHNESLYHYKSMIEKLNYLEKSSQPNITYAGHQYAFFLQDPKQSNSKAILYLVKYLKKQGKWD